MKNLYIEEFLAVAGFLEKSGKVPVEKGYIIVSRQIIDGMLSKNAYDTVENKLKVWKLLHWIDADPDRYTKKISRNGKRIRVIKIDVSVYKTLNAIWVKEPGQFQNSNRGNCPADED